MIQFFNLITFILRKFYCVPQTSRRRLTQMSIKSKISTCVKKMTEAAQYCETLNELENSETQKSLLSKVQAFFMLDTGRKAHFAGYGAMFQNFLQNQDLGNFSGKGTTPVEATDGKK